MGGNRQGFGPGQIRNIDLRRDELQHVDAVHAIHGLDSAFRMANHQTPIRLDSGLVEMQAWFRKLKS
jgi:hypothetical protein